MKARDIIGRTIVGVRQARVSTSWSGYGVEGDDSKELASEWAVEGFELDNGGFLVVMGVETDTEPIVKAWVIGPRERKAKP